MLLRLPEFRIIFQFPYRTWKLETINSYIPQDEDLLMFCNSEDTSMGIILGTSIEQPKSSATSSMKCTSSSFNLCHNVCWSKSVWKMMIQAREMLSSVVINNALCCLKAALRRHISIECLFRPFYLCFYSWHKVLKHPVYMYYFKEYCFKLQLIQFILKTKEGKI